MHPPLVAPHPTLSIVIPLFNEEENIPLFIPAIRAVLGDDPHWLELVMVDDGSSDQTAQIAREFCAADPRLRFVQHEQNRGLGAAIRTGLRAAQGDLVLYTDADLPFDFGLIPQLLQLAKPGNIVIGCRNNRGEGGRRWLLSKGYNLLTWLALGVRVRDINFACKLLPQRAVRGMRLHSEGSFIDAEMLLECRRLGYDIAELPMTYYPRQLGQSTLSRPGVVVGILVEMARYLWRRITSPRPPLGAPMNEMGDEPGR